MSRETRDILAAYRGQNHCVPIAIATVVSVEGSSYRRPGARMLVCADGLRIGSVSAGCLEADVAEHARCVHQTGEPRYVVYDPKGPSGDLFLETACHGRIGILIEPMRTASTALDILDECVRFRRPSMMATVYQGDCIATHFVVDEQHESPSDRVFIERIVPPIALIVCGAGRDSHPLAGMTSMLGWQVTVVDTRRDLLDHSAFAGTAVVSCSPEYVDSNVAVDPWSAIVIMTHNYMSDLALLKQLLPSKAGYVGLLGSRSRGVRLRGDLLDAGIALSSHQWKRFHSPAGFDIGSETPDEIALSIISEVQASLRGRVAESLA